MAAYVRVLLRTCKEFRSILHASDFTFSYTRPGLRCFSTQPLSNERSNNYGEKGKPVSWEQRNRFGRDEQQKNILTILDSNRSVKPGEFRRIFSTIQREKEKNGTLISEQEASLLLHICCTAMINFPPPRRVAAAKEVWNTVLEHDVKPTLKLFNMRLKVFKDNKHSIDPIKEMSYLTDIGLTPDVVTYSMLIGCFCNDGDIEGADIILQTMKDHDLGININVFNSYIRGHLKNNSLQQALDTLDLIKLRDLTPNAETYHNFACFYALNGDSSNVKSYQDLSEASGVPFSDIQLLDIYKSFIRGGHKQMSKDFMAPLTEVGWFKYSIDMSSSLIADGMIEEGIELFNSYRDYVRGGISSLLISMLESGHKPRSVIKVSEGLLKESFDKEESPKSQNRDWEESLLLYCYAQRGSEGCERFIDWAVEYLQLINKSGLKTNPNYSIPILCFHRDYKNVEKLKEEASKFIQSLDSNNSYLVLHILHHLVLPAFLEMGLSREDIRKIGDEAVWNSVFLKEDEWKKDIDYAVAELGEGKINTFLSYETQFLKNLINSAHWQKSLDVTMNMPNKNLTRYLRLNILRMLMVRRKSEVEAALEYMKDNNMTISGWISERFFNAEDPEAWKKKLMELATPSKQVKKNVFNHQDLMDMDLEKLFSIATTRIHAKSVYLTKVFKMYYKPGNTKLFEDSYKKNITEFTKAILNQGDWNLNPSHLSLMNYFLRIDQVEDASAVFENLAKKYETISIQTSIRIARAQIDKGDFQKCLQTLTMSKNNQIGDTFTDDVKRRKFVLETKVLFEKASSKQELDALKEAFTFVPMEVEIQHEGFYLSNLLKFCDDDQIVEAFTESVSKFNRYPMLTLILTRLVKNHNVDLLKVVMNLCLKKKTEVMFHSRLATAFLLADMPTKALKVLKTPGIRFPSNVLLDTAEVFVRRKEIKALENLFEISKHFPVNQALMLDYLIQGYVLDCNLEKALSVFETVCQEATILKPLPSTINVLKIALEKNGMDIPHNLSGT